MTPSRTPARRNDHHPVVHQLPTLRGVDVGRVLRQLEASDLRAMGTVCAAHVHDSWVPIEIHHVWPLGHGGPNTPGNRIPLCSNAHSAIHDLLLRLIKGQGEVPWEIRRRFGYTVRMIAERGYTEIMEHRRDA